jgi:hypothetical protein
LNVAKLWKKTICHTSKYCENKFFGGTMLKKYSALSIIMLAVFALSLSAWATDVSGDWDLTSQTRRGERTQTIHIEQDGEKITVTMPGRGGDEMKGEGTIVENKIEWTISFSTQRGDFEMKYTGTVEGDTMTGQVERGGRGSSEWTAKKK